MNLEINEKSLAQIIFWIEEFTKLSNSFFSEGDYKLHEYWKGQVMGACKVIDLLGIEIDTSHYLNQLI